MAMRPAALDFAHIYLGFATLVERALSEQSVVSSSPNFHL
jgi:hypothetical protein